MTAPPGESIEYGHVFASYVKSVADTPADTDPYPDIATLSGQVTFAATFPGAQARGSIRLPAEPRAQGLIVTGDTFEIVNSVLVDHEGREGVWLVAAVDDVPISWQASVTLKNSAGQTIYNKAYILHYDLWFKVDEELQINLPDLIPTPGRLEPPEGAAIELAQATIAQIEALTATNQQVKLDVEGLKSEVVTLHGQTGQRLTAAEAAKVAAEAARAAAEAAERNAKTSRDEALGFRNDLAGAEERVSIEHEHIHQDVNHVDDAAAQVAAAIRQANVFSQDQVPPYLQEEALDNRYSSIRLDTDGTPYFVINLGGAIQLDTDGVPYF